MEVTAVVLHKGALAHYDVTIGTDGVCVAHLSSYNGAATTSPPHCITLQKEGRHWVSDSTHPNLSDDLGYAVELKARPFLDQRNRFGGHPAG